MAVTRVADWWPARFAAGMLGSWVPGEQAAIALLLKKLNVPNTEASEWLLATCPAGLSAQEWPKPGSGAG